MKRIQPECFIYMWRGSTDFIHQYYPLPFKHKNWVLTKSYLQPHTPIALFLIKPTSIPLAERLEARKVNNNLNP
jgi:hypothetical protein